MESPGLELKRWTRKEYYARAGRQESWVLNLVDRVLEVRREPEVSTTAPYGWDYRVLHVLRPGDHVVALAGPAAPMAVADLLPPT